VRGVQETGNKEQPISIFYEGDDGDKPYKPGKSMRRVMKHLWGANGDDYVGRSMTLYCDPTVRFGKDEVGGIRISHMSDIDGPKEVPLQLTKGVKKPFKVQVLRQATQQQNAPQATLQDAQGAISGAADLAALEKAWRSNAMAPFREQLQEAMESRKAALTSTQAQIDGPEQGNGFDAL
jgi:hypothetical protein